ncbi:MAG: hypothetical protein AAFQ23_02800 [Cyanobacteria bacterium J06623_1]
MTIVAFSGFDFTSSKICASVKLLQAKILNEDLHASNLEILTLLSKTDAFYFIVRNYSTRDWAKVASCGKPRFFNLLKEGGAAFVPKDTATY